jgi:hypothetical protein
MFDVFYFNKKPNLFPHERRADSFQHAQELSRTRYFWVVDYLLDYSEFDFLWEPVPWQSEYTHVWPTQWDQFYGAYLVPKQGEIKYHHHTESLPAKQFPENYKQLADAEFDFSWIPHPWDPPYVYVFGNQWHPAEKMPTIEYHAPGATERKFMARPRATLAPNQTNWQVPDSVEIADVDFSWVPDPGAPPYIYQFATQHQKTGGPVYTVPGAKEIKYIDQLKVKTNRVASAVYEIDHLDGNAKQIPNTTKTIRYFDNYRDTLIRLAKSIGDDHEFVWVCSSICDYANFDFSWHPEQWQATMLHVFASSKEKFGDTFFMHVPTFAARAEQKALLEWYDVNFVPHSVPRRPLPVIEHHFDTHVEAVKKISFNGPLALYSAGPVLPGPVPVVSLWREQTKTIVPLSKGASTVVIPKTAVSTINVQLYDYAYIDKTKRSSIEAPMDVIFISNGESMAEQNWQRLLSLCPRAKRSDGVTGRELAYKTAAKMSETPWFFAVFAKTEVIAEFTFDFQPDRMQQPKHYIFHSRNPVNGLEYGAMNINLYNKQLVLDTVPGIDFTLSAAHEVVPICASISRFNTDPWVSWRSAFREVLKLQQEVDQGAGIEIRYRLDTWCNTASGDNAEWVLKGASDAQEYYHAVNGDNNKLMLSFDWAWLQQYYESKYNTCPWLESV